MTFQLSYRQDTIHNTNRTIVDIIRYILPSLTHVQLVVLSDEYLICLGHCIDRYTVVLLMPYLYIAERTAQSLVNFGKALV